MKLWDESEVQYLRRQVVILKQELKDEREAHNRASGLMMNGEALRESTMITAILAGAFGSGEIDEN